MCVVWLWTETMAVGDTHVHVWMFNAGIQGVNISAQFNWSKITHHATTFTREHFDIERSMTYSLLSSYPFSGCVKTNNARRFRRIQLHVRSVIWAWGREGTKGCLTTHHRHMYIESICDSRTSLAYIGSRRKHLCFLTSSGGCRDCSGKVHSNLRLQDVPTHPSPFLTPFPHSNTAAHVYEGK